MKQVPKFLFVLFFSRSPSCRSFSLSNGLERDGSAGFDSVNLGQAQLPGRYGLPFWFSRHGLRCLLCEQSRLAADEDSLPKKVVRVDSCRWWLPLCLRRFLREVLAISSSTMA
jgi:hypothetical protein